MFGLITKSYPITSQENVMAEKSHQQAWEEFKKSPTYTGMFNTLNRVFAVAMVPEPDELTELTIKTAFVQGYIYRSL